MVTTNGIIQRTQYYNALNTPIERTELKWVGGPIIEISSNLINSDNISNPECLHYISVPGDIVRYGPFRLKVLEWQWAKDYVTLIRINSPLDYLIYYWYRSNKLLDLIYHRLIITATVWNLASHDSGVSSSWRDFYIVQTIRKLIHQ